MRNRIRLRRAIAALTISAALTTLPALRAHAPAHASPVLRTSVSTTLCDFQWRRGRRQLSRLIRCSARHWPVVGGPDKAVFVARCESSLDPKAYNAEGYAGVFQQATRYWPGRSVDFGFPRWSVFNGRANVMVSIRMAHRYGWGAWSCA